MRFHVRALNIDLTSAPHRLGDLHACSPITALPGDLDGDELPQPAPKKPRPKPAGFDLTELAALRRELRRALAAPPPTPPQPT